MKKPAYSAVLFLCLTLPGAALSQTTEKPPAFEKAYAHTAAPSSQMRGSGFSAGNRFEARGYTMLDLISMAYGFYDRDKMIGGPFWAARDKFDILATLPANTPPPARQPMLRALLAERFHVAVHTENRPMPVYVLIAGKKPLLRESAPDTPSECKNSRVENLLTLTCTNMPVDLFADRINAVASEYFNHPLFDQTGLKGHYDFSMSWTVRGRLGLPGADGESTGIAAFAAIEKQLGLKVESQQRPLPVLMIDHADRVPTENEPGVADALLTPAQSEFEVAELRPHKPDTPSSSSIRNDRVAIMGVTLRNIMTLAYDTRGDQLVGGPKWIDSDRFDLIAKAPGIVPWDDMQVMLRKLIVERFHLTFHQESQPVPVFALSVGKLTSKLKLADPASRSECKRTRVDGNNNTAYFWTMTCQNTTMVQLTDQFRTDASGYVTLAAVDLTGLPEGYDFTLTWSPAERTAAPGTGPGMSMTAGVVAASAPSGGLTFFEALDRQLGLKLQQQKHPMPVTVIDHAEQP